MRHHTTHTLSHTQQVATNMTLTFTISYTPQAMESKEMLQLRAAISRTQEVISRITNVIPETKEVLSSVSSYVL